MLPPISGRGWASAPPPARVFLPVRSCVDHSSGPPEQRAREGTQTRLRMTRLSMSPPPGRGWLIKGLRPRLFLSPVLAGSLIVAASQGKRKLAYA